MTRRVAEWHLVDRASDPVPADSYDVGRVAKEFEDRGRVMEDAASTLSALAGLDGWTGEAAVKFAEKAEEAHSDLGKAADKYTDAGAALRTYAGHVQTARTATWNAVKAAEEADATRRASANPIPGADADDATPEEKQAESDRATAHSDAVTALNNAKTALEEAMSALSTAATNAAHRINKASEKFKDSTMDNIKGFVAAAIDVLNVVALVLGAIIIVILTIATLGGFAVALGGLFMALTIVSATVLALTLVQAAMGEAGLSEVLWATVGVIGGPLGKLGSKLAAPALARMTTVARAAAASGARGSLTYRAAGLVGRIPFGPLQARMAAHQTRLVDNAVAAVNTRLATLPQAGGLSQLAGLDALTNTLRQHRALTSMADQLPRDIWAVRGGMAVQGLGGTASMAATTHDTAGIAGPMTRTWDNLQHLDDVFRFDAPDRPTTVVPVGR